MDVRVGGMGKSRSISKHKHSNSKDTNLKPYAAPKTYYTQQKCWLNGSIRFGDQG